MAEEKKAEEKKEKEKEKTATKEEAKKAQTQKAGKIEKTEKAMEKTRKHITASARAEDARVSTKNSIILMKEIRGKKVEKAKALLEGLVSEKRSLRKKHYTNAAKKILEVLEGAEANAKAKALNEARLFIVTTKADKGRTFARPRSRMGRRGEVAKMTNLEIVVGER